MKDDPRQTSEIIITDWNDGTVSVAVAFEGYQIDGDFEHGNHQDALKEAQAIIAEKSKWAT
tara:strand:- start:916 stop:1098 length:183 start_codon:yes stop_codon:yes gene_type:complete